MSFVVENNVIKTQDLEFDFAELEGLGVIIFNAMQKFKNNVAQIDAETGQKNTYDEILCHCIRTAMVMKHKGIKKGDIIMGCSDNHLDACIPIIAALFLGAIPCSMDPFLTTLEAIEIFRQIQPKMIFVISAAVENVERILRDLNLNPEIVVFGSSTNHSEFQTFIEKQIGEEEFEPEVSHDPFETAVIYLSSGTSGLAKACCLTHAYFIKESNLVPTNTSVEHLDLERRSFEWSQIRKGGAFLCYSALYWISGGKILFQNVFIGGTRVLCKKFDIKTFWELVEKYRILIALLAPYDISEVVKLGRPLNVNTDSLIKVLTGGTPLQVVHYKALQALLPDADIVQTYGLTETGIITGFEVYNKVHRKFYRNHPDCLGYPTRGVWYKIIDLDTNETLGPNQEGELLVKSKYFFNGYYNRPISETFDPDGWFRTGDVAYYTDDYAFYVTDRLKELLKYRQLTVYPYVIENELYKHPAVKHATVLGIPHVEDGERPAAFVVLHEGFESVTAEELRRFADERTQDKAQLRGGLRIVKSLPVTPSGKIKRRELRKIVLDENK